MRRSCSNSLRIARLVEGSGHLFSLKLYLLDLKLIVFLLLLGLHLVQKLPAVARDDNVMLSAHIASCKGAAGKSRLWEFASLPEV